jgi:hypothetical protein
LRKRSEILETVGYSCGVHDVEAQQRTAAVELEVEVASVCPWLYEELHTAIFVDGIHIVRVYASHVPVPNQENAEKPISIIEQSGIGLRTMVTTLRAEVGDL